jgi:hypothetical protein
MSIDTERPYDIGAIKTATDLLGVAEEYDVDPGDLLAEWLLAHEGLRSSPRDLFSEPTGFPLPDWDTEGGNWEFCGGYQDPKDPHWERWAERKFGDVRVSKYETWSASEGYQQFETWIWGDGGLGDEPLRDIDGCTASEQARAVAADLIAAADFLESLTGGTK